VLGAGAEVVGAKVLVDGISASPGATPQAETISPAASMAIRSLNRFMVFRRSHSGFGFRDRTGEHRDDPETTTCALWEDEVPRACRSPPRDQCRRAEPGLDGRPPGDLHRTRIRRRRHLCRQRQRAVRIEKGSRHARARDRGDARGSIRHPDRDGGAHARRDARTGRLGPTGVRRRGLPLRCRVPQAPADRGGGDASRRAPQGLRPGMAPQGRPLLRPAERPPHPEQDEQDRRDPRVSTDGDPQLVDDHEAPRLLDERTAD